jgi:hypothetical protein
MNPREFDITIGPDGRVQVHVQGYKGKSCLEAVELFKQIVGEIQEQQSTSEMYEPEEMVQYHLEQHH